jgi:hypothetical protein
MKLSQGLSHKEDKAMKPLNEKILNCSKCGEDAVLVSFNGKNMVRPRRFSKCKGYTKCPKYCCASDVFDNKDDAIEDWNVKRIKL